MDNTLMDVEQAIRRMTRVLKGVPDIEPGAEVPGGGWWVLAVGDSLKGREFEEREQARERLKSGLDSTGITLPKYVWVWDETERAQVVVATLPSRERAEKLADRLGEKGLRLRVVREMDDEESV